MVLGSLAIDPRYVQPVTKKSRHSQMFWGGIRYGVKSDLAPCYGDEASKKGGVTARVYKEILEDNLPTLMDPDTIFMQDNAPIHTSKLLREYLAEMHFNILTWPPYSPDLNPIENLWSMLKERILKRYPELSTMSKNEETLRKLCEAAVIVWHDFEIELVNRLIESVPRRVEAIYKAGGWYTKY